MALPGLPEIKQHLQVFHDEQDDTIEQFALAAQVLIEDWCGVKLTLEEDLSETIRGGYAALGQAFGPLDSESVTVTDEDGAEVEIVVREDEIHRADGMEWDTRYYVVAYAAGYADPPAPLVTAWLKLIARFYAVRDDAAGTSNDGFSRTWNEMRDGDLRVCLTNYRREAY